MDIQNKTKILLIEDDTVFQLLVQEKLAEAGFEVIVKGRGKEGIAAFRKENPAVTMVDLVLPDITGIEVLNNIFEHDPDAMVLVLTGHATVDSSLEALKMGAEDYLPKPINFEHLILSIKRSLQKKKLKREYDILAAEEKEISCGEMLGVSESMRLVFREIDRAAKSNDNVLIQGEVGTGKDLAARAIHDFSNRSSAPFIKINCESIPTDLLAVELFGYTAGAFPEAEKKKSGKFEIAKSGTILFESLHLASEEIQAKLMQVLTKKEIIPFGARESIPVDVRVLVSCTQDLEKLAMTGKFREDLFYKIIERIIYMPALRQRKEDIPVLANKFLREAAVEHPEKEQRVFSPRCLQGLTAYNWFGNVSELKNFTFRAAIDSPRAIIRPMDLSLDLQKKLNRAESHFPTLEDVEKEHIIRALNQASFNKVEAAQLLGISRSSLYALIKKYQLKNLK